MSELLEQVHLARKTHDRTLNVLRLKSGEVRTFSWIMEIVLYISRGSHVLMEEMRQMISFVNWEGASSIVFIAMSRLS